MLGKITLIEIPVTKSHESSLPTNGRDKKVLHKIPAKYQELTKGGIIEKNIIHSRKMQVSPLEKRNCHALPHRKEKKRKEKKNYAGNKTLPASIKEKETHWPEVL